MLSPLRLFAALLLLLFLVSPRAEAQVPGVVVPIDTLDRSRVQDSAAMGDTVKSDFWSFRLALGAQVKVGAPLSGRLILDARSPRLGVAPVTFASLTGRDNLGAFLSINPIILVPAYLGFFIHPVVGAIFLLPQVVPNLSFESPLVADHFGVVAAQRTDYFYQNEVFRVHTETQLGVRYHNANVMVELLYAIPLTSSVMERRGYVAAGLSVDVIK